MTHKPITFTPTLGGRLATDISANEAGLANYRVKRDWRRYLDREMRREGHEVFWDELDGLGEPINLVHLARSPDRKTALIVGTPTTLYRYMMGTVYVEAVEAGAVNTVAGVTYTDAGGEYVSGDADGPYILETSAWAVIGSGFAADGNRWEVADLGGDTIFNNGVDLPVAYRLNVDSVVTPLYELRENGVIAVGTIAQANSVLLLGDITQVKPSLEANLWALADPYGRVTDLSLSDRIPFRIMGSGLNSPRRFAAAVACAITAGSRTLTMTHHFESFYGGQEVLVTGAGVSGGNLQATILSISGTTVTLDTAASTTVLATDTLDSLGKVTVAGSQMSAADMLGGMVFYDDLEEDGSRIIRMLALNDVVVIYRDSGYQLAQYTGTTGSPWSIPKMVQSANTLFYKNSLIAVSFKGYAAHLYAGRNEFWRFDATSRIPTGAWSGAAEDIKLCAKTFFDEAAQGETFSSGGQTLRRMDYVFAADNELTQEVFLCFPSATGPDYAICFDYDQGTLSTTGAAYSAAGMAVQPGPEDQKWFFMGTLDGRVLRYGRSNVTQAAWGDKSAMYNRNGVAYASELYSGLGHFGNPFHEKALNAYVLELSSLSPDTPVTVELYGATNPNAPVSDLEERGEHLLVSQSLTVGDNLLPVSYLHYYFADRIIVAAKDAACEISARTYSVLVVGSGSATRGSGL